MEFPVYKSLISTKFEMELFGKKCQQVSVNDLISPLWVELPVSVESSEVVFDRDIQEKFVE